VGGAERGREGKRQMERGRELERQTEQIALQTVRRCDGGLMEYLWEQKGGTGESRGVQKMRNWREKERDDTTAENRCS
jgi:hypothetical protein